MRYSGLTCIFRKHLELHFRALKLCAIYCGLIYCVFHNNTMVIDKEGNDNDTVAILTDFNSF